MAFIHQIKRGSTEALSSFVGRPGQLVFNTSLNNLWIHDGVTAGGLLVTGLAQEAVQALLNTGLADKVDKVDGKGLSSNDYTSAEKTKLGGIASGATVNQTDAFLTSRSNHTGTQAISAVSGLQGALDAKVATEAGKGLSTNDYTTAEKNKLGGIADGATANSSDSTLLNRAYHTGTQSINTITGLQSALDGKVAAVNGMGLSSNDYTTDEKTKLGGIAAGATVNSTDATLLARGNHTGTQAISTVTGLQSALDSKLGASANAVSASAWQTARTITLGGDLTGSVSINGSQDVTLNAEVKDDSHLHYQLAASNTRTNKPNTLVTTLARLTAHFTTLGGLLSATADTDYQDMLVLDTWNDTSAGMINALVFDKSEMVIRHFQAARDATSWGTAKTIAYTDQLGGRSSGWTTPRTLSLTGDGTASLTVDGTANVSGALTLATTGVAAGSYAKVTVDTKGRVTAGGALAAADIPAIAISGVTGLQSALDGKLASGATAAAATKLATARALTATGDASWSVNFDGTADASAALTLATTGVTAGTYTKLTVDAKGRVTGGTTLAAADIPLIDISKVNTLQSALDGKLASNGTAVAASKLATPRTLAFTGDATGTNTFDGSANISTALTLANSGVTAGTYTKVVVDAKGRVTGSATLAYSDLPFTPVRQGGGTNQGTNAVLIGWSSVANDSTLRLMVDTTDFGNAWPISAALGAAKWTTARTLSYTGDVTGSASVDGSANVSTTLTLANSGVTAGTYTKVTVDAKGRVTGSGSVTASELGVKSMGLRDVFISTAAPASTDGNNGDIWLQYS